MSKPLSKAVNQDPGLFPEDGLCAAGRTCLEWLSADPSLSDGSYAVDPDGSGVGLGPVALGRRRWS